MKKAKKKKTAIVRTPVDKTHPVSLILSFCEGEQWCIHEATHYLAQALTALTYLPDEDDEAN